MKKIFLDLGCNKLQGLLQIAEHRLPIDESWAIRCFEANASVYREALNGINNSKNREFRFSKFPDFKLENAAVSNKTTLVEIKNVVEYTARNGVTYSGDGGASTLLPYVRWHHKNVKFETAQVRSIDINTIIADLVREYGEVVEIYIKCDIEGHEYPVLYRLAESEHLNKLRKIYVEWHPHFFEDEKARKAEAYEVMRCLCSRAQNLDVSFHS